MTTVILSGSWAAARGFSGEGDICPHPTGKASPPAMGLLTAAYCVGIESSSLMLGCPVQGRMLELAVEDRYHWVPPPWGLAPPLLLPSFSPSPAPNGLPADIPSACVGASRQLCMFVTLLASSTHKSQDCPLNLQNTAVYKNYKMWLSQHHPVPL